jgi:hypothetical protein
MGGAIAGETLTRLPDNAIAQRVGTCRATVAQIAIYEQPNAQSRVIGTIPEGGSMMLGEGRAEGWIRIVQPDVGWVDTSFLIGNDSSPCPSGFSAYNPPSAPVAPLPPATQPSPPVTPPPEVSMGMTQCQVTPENGLIVRNQPVISDRTYIATIPSGTQEFAFTNRVRATITPEGRRSWIYITAPYEGWVSTGFVGDPSNLSGVGCP